MPKNRLKIAEHIPIVVLAQDGLQTKNSLYKCCITCRVLSCPANIFNISVHTSRLPVSAVYNDFLTTIGKHNYLNLHLRLCCHSVDQRILITGCVYPPLLCISYDIDYPHSDFGRNLGLRCLLKVQIHTATCKMFSCKVWFYGIW